MNVSCSPCWFLRSVKIISRVFLSFLTFDFSTVLAKDVDKLDETEENVTSGDLEDVKETRVARSFPEKSASKVYFFKIIKITFSILSIQNSDPQPRFCKLPKKAGNCRGHFPRFFYDKNSGQCREFVYTGCRGNNNRFLSREKCECMCVRN